MWGRRIGYLAALLGSLVFYGFYKEWFSWIALLLVVFLPWISLVFSLPAILTVKAELRCPEKTRQDMPVRTALKLKSKLPTPPVRCTIRLINHLTGQRFLGEPGERIPTEHCGRMTISYPYMYVYDYLGLFRRRLNREAVCTIMIEPKPVETAQLPTGKQTRSMHLWRPKPGGGFSEVYDLRTYRPGDELRQIHWKMSAKTGKLIYREAMEPIRQGNLLTLTLSGSPEQLDRKLGQLLYLSKALLEKQQEHRISCFTGRGLMEYQVRDAATLETALHGMLSASPAREEGHFPEGQALWQKHIGGGKNEA